MRQSEKLFLRKCNSALSTIRKKYPLLHDAKIEIVLGDLGPGSMKAMRVTKLKYRIQIDFRKYAHAKINQVVGALAHELVHFEDYSKMTRAAYAAFWRKYYARPSFVRKIERDTDERTIERGFGKLLLINREFRKKAQTPTQHKNAQKVYMFKKEILAYMRKNKIK